MFGYFHMGSLPCSMLLRERSRYRGNRRFSRSSRGPRIVIQACMNGRSWRTSAGTTAGLSVSRRMRGVFRRIFGASLGEITTRDITQGKRRATWCVELKQRFESLTAAGRFVGRPPSNILQAIYSHNRCGSYHWEYFDPACHLQDPSACRCGHDAVVVDSGA